jgi:GGDEF domain-containing protein
MQVSAPRVAPSGQLWALTGALVLLVDASQRVVAANPAACLALALAERDLVGRDPVEIVVPREVADFRHELRTGLHGDVPATYEHELRTFADDRRVIVWSISRLLASPAQVGCVGVDVTAARNDSEVLRQRAVTDELTGLANRSGLRDHVARMAGSGASVVFCDLNGFKAVNDVHGHDVGDAVLVQVARRLQRTTRGEDFVARIGGDEFVIVAPPDVNSDFQTDYVGGQPVNPVTDTIFTNTTITGAQQSSDAFNAKSGYGIWANQLPEAGQGPAMGSATFNGLTESNDFINIENTTSTFTITVNGCLRGSPRALARRPRRQHPPPR